LGTKVYSGVLLYVSDYLRTEKNGRTTITRVREKTASALIFCFSFHRVTPKPKV
jgi:hypothetical protein